MQATFRIIELIADGIFIGFSLSVIFNLIVSYFLKSEKHKSLFYNYRSYAIYTVRFLSLAYVLFYSIRFIYFISTNDFYIHNERATGPYAFNYWFILLRPVLYCGLLQLFWIKPFRKKKLYVLVLATITLVLSFLSATVIEKIIIYVSALHRDYLPSDWEMQLDSQPILLLYLYHIFEKIILFNIIVGLIWFISSKKWLKIKL